jgi:hypothetical protein
MSFGPACCTTRVTTVKASPMAASAVPLSSQSAIVYDLFCSRVKRLPFRTNRLLDLEFEGKSAGRGQEFPLPLSGSLIYICASPSASASTTKLLVPEGEILYVVVPVTLYPVIVALPNVKVPPLTVLASTVVEGLTVWRVIAFRLTVKEERASDGDTIIGDGCMVSDEIGLGVIVHDGEAQALPGKTVTRPL